MDPSLGIGDKILLPDDKKPQAKHLLSRSEYLLKVLKKYLDQKKGVVSFLLFFFVLGPRDKCSLMLNGTRINSGETKEAEEKVEGIVEGSHR